MKGDLFGLQRERTRGKYSLLDFSPGQVNNWRYYREKITFPSQLFAEKVQLFSDQK